ncbi:MAG: hypothetical protein PSV17_05750 [Methylotenera sp.]|uniref:hypothetical protein n=1 Tax=Methylotenera sp. TaxID=2051956 RepID=UPI002488B18A|nr:hypothetical protein [Methylotenera sp.]MDI1308921.1 hypothetical protein [Methylotenera sp.]
MAIVLKRIISKGPDKADAEINFSNSHCLIRGPSDTGKSYIRDCLWYMLGGDKQPKTVPEDEGYNTLTLEITSGDEDYIITRGLRGGGVSIDSVNNKTAPEQLTPIEDDLNDLIVRLAGAADMQTMRSVSKKGGVTSGDLRHWFLLSQPSMISEDPTSGSNHVDRTQRVAAFHVFLTGKDDSAIVLAQSKSDKDKIAGRIFAAEEGIKRANAGIPADLEKADVVSALSRVDETLQAVTRQYDARAALLRDTRQKITQSITELNLSEAARIQSEAMLQRFNLLDSKYQSDLDRLGAINEGTAYYQSLDSTPCPICGSALKEHGQHLDLEIESPKKYRAAVAAEAEKIQALRIGLRHSIDQENRRLKTYTDISNQEREQLVALEKFERDAINSLKVEFSSDPRELAIRHSELSSQLNLLEEIERLELEIKRLKDVKRSKSVPVLREALAASTTVAKYAKDLLDGWGLADVKTVRLDTESCDLYINERARLSYGAGRRALFLTALSISLLKFSMENNHPHLGFVVIDSPLKAYADPESKEQIEVPLSTVRDGFYSWLANWEGPGQVIILENEKVPENLLTTINPIQFGGERSGFYPKK